jgi:hypothetical protein
VHGIIAFVKSSIGWTHCICWTEAICPSRECQSPGLASRANCNASGNSQENHRRIGEAIGEVAAGLSSQFPGIRISRDGHYQLSNRLAFAWKLASLGIPSVLVYLGLTGDDGIRDVCEPFAHDDHWQHTFRDHLQTVCPTSVLAVPIDVGPASFWVLSRSRPILEVSPPRP